MLRSLAILEEPIELAAVVRDIVALKTGRKIVCTSRMCSPMPTFAPVLSAGVRRPGQVIGMGVGLQDPLDRICKPRCRGLKDGVC